MKLWIARDRCGDLNLFTDNPILMDIGCFTHPIHSFTGKFPLTSIMFPEVTFENSPQQVELKLIK